MSEPASGNANRSVFAGALHYSNLVALVGTAFVFLTIFVTGGTAQLIKMPYDRYEGLYGESVWDYVWNNIQAEDITVGRQSGFIVSFTLAFVVALLCVGVSRKVMKEGNSPLLASSSVVLSGVGAGILHSYASLLFVIPAFMGLLLLVAPLFKGLGLQMGKAGAAGWSMPGQSVQAGAFAAPGQPLDPAVVAVAPTAYAGAPGGSSCPSCGAPNARHAGAAFCSHCGARF